MTICINRHCLGAPKYREGGCIPDIESYRRFYQAICRVGRKSGGSGETDDYATARCWYVSEFAVVFFCRAILRDNHIASAVHNIEEYSFLEGACFITVFLIHMIYSEIHQN